MELDVRSRQWICTYPQQGELKQEQVLYFSKLPGWKATYAIQSISNGSVSVYLDLKNQVKASTITQLCQHDDIVLKRTTLSKLNDFKDLPHDISLEISPPVSTTETETKEANEEHSSECEQETEHSSSTINDTVDTEDTQDEQVLQWVRGFKKRKAENILKINNLKKRHKELLDGTIQVQHELEIQLKELNDKSEKGHTDLMEILNGC